LILVFFFFLIFLEKSRGLSNKLNWTLQHTRPVSRGYSRLTPCQPGPNSACKSTSPVTEHHTSPALKGT
jgi:hypothetical protein